MPEPLVADWDLIHRWEWFRRTRWRAGFRAAIHGVGGGLTRAFGDLAHMAGGEVLLDASCGLGRRAILLAEKGHHIVGSDQSGVAIARAKELARDESSPATFFKSTWSDLPKHIPHRFDGILASALALVPTFDQLGAAFVGMFHALNPGGFVMWTGPGEHDPAESVRQHLTERWRAEPTEKVEWFHREGQSTCALVKLIHRASDYVDERRLYVSEEGGISNLEATTIRWPGYWTWTHWRDLTRMAGFVHVETRRYEGFGQDGGALQVNVAWRGKEGGEPPLPPPPDDGEEGISTPEDRPGEADYR